MATTGAFVCNLFITLSVSECVCMPVYETQRDYLFLPSPCVSWGQIPAAFWVIRAGTMPACVCDQVKSIHSKGENTFFQNINLPKKNHIKLTFLM